MSGNPISLALTPPKQAWHGHPVTVRVTDIGADPLRITTSTVVLHAHCATTTSADVHVIPRAFTLHPGQTVTATITVPDSAGDYGVAFAGEPLTQQSGGTVAGAVGSQVLAGGATSCVPVAVPKTAAKAAAQPAARPAAQPAAGGFPLLAVVIPLAVIVALAVAFCVGRRTGRARERA
jgi:hypothetical protein